MEYVAPAFKKNAFHCPICKTFAHMGWVSLVTTSAPMEATDLFQARCARCQKETYWRDDKSGDPRAPKGKMIYPLASNAPLPSSDLPEDCQQDYAEARAIAAQSPRAAAALLRLIIQKLCKHFGEPGKDINKDIGRLVEKGLPKILQEALDTVRVIGNAAVHPGEINFEDNPEIVTVLFRLINLIVEKMITEPKEMADLYQSLPTSKLEQIAKRDQSN
ncbi:DUF4145 domain-containing protein [Leeia aquatica]|uniref:DUF4145 domain-containing protein n=1 Tax=Leeia aquatica TaxID=2725557 RepID=A0A847RUS9_9NEIS|nr:DUF4145 domain-containing protein [Leeia aquatica]NLR73591.1 DUF4145 domain-containing protein [Leeia aquatica]